MTKGYHDKLRQLLRISGSDRQEFLQGLVSNDVAKTANGPVYAALLSAQGKYLFDFFLTAESDAILLDVAASRAQALAQRLAMYRLRADVQIAADERPVWRGTGDLPAGAIQDPRHEAMGWRYYGVLAVAPLPEDHFEALRVEHIIPEPELLENETYILEAGFGRLNGVDFRKGCYVGQEITARMKHKTELKKGLVRVAIQGEAEFGAVITADEKPAGTLFTVVDGQGLAHLRFDRAKGEMRAKEATLHRVA
ncbi:MAG: folate-binding protein [Rhodobacteraceae bacterium]|nr:folate-binding protein [Paracoccaceae bacterium]